MADVISLVPPPTVQERYDHFRENATLFVDRMRTMVAALEREGKEEEAAQLRVWALMPWEAALRDDDSGDLWPVCEVCSRPIKEDRDCVSSDEGCSFHRACIHQ